MCGTMALWEATIEMTGGAADTVAVDPVSAEAEAVVALAEEDLLLAEPEAETAKCSQLSAVTVEKSAKFLLNLQTANLFIVVIVLKKWVTEVIDLPTTDQDLKIDLPEPLKHKADRIWVQLTPNLIKY